MGRAGLQNQRPAPLVGGRARFLERFDDTRRGHRNSQARCQGHGEILVRRDAQRRFVRNGQLRLTDEALPCACQRLHGEVGHRNDQVDDLRFDDALDGIDETRRVAPRIRIDDRVRHVARAEAQAVGVHVCRQNSIAAATERAHDGNGATSIRVGDEYRLPAMLS